MCSVLMVEIKPHHLPQTASELPLHGLSKYDF